MTSDLSTLPSVVNFSSPITHCFSKLLFEAFSFGIGESGQEKEVYILTQQCVCFE
ncbi:hypothetical protein C0J52_22658 [Blattella germanica]|nr:hypothetical protein C0J52_22658 [Blattella germanica]